MSSNSNSSQIPQPSSQPLDQFAIGSEPSLYGAPLPEPTPTIDSIAWMQNIQQQVTLLTQSMSLMQQLMSASHPPQQSSHPTQSNQSALKVPAPSPFNGSKDSAEAFLMNLAQYFKSKKTVPSDAEKVNFALSLCSVVAMLYTLPTNY